MAVGADFIQIDEPHHGMYSGRLREVTKGINKAVEGVEVPAPLRPTPAGDRTASAPGQAALLCDCCAHVFEARE